LQYTKQQNNETKNNNIKTLEIMNAQFLKLTTLLIFGLITTTAFAAITLSLL